MCYDQMEFFGRVKEMLHTVVPASARFNPKQADRVLSIKNRRGVAELRLAICRLSSAIWLSIVLPFAAGLTRAYWKAWGS